MREMKHRPKEEEESDTSIEYSHEFRIVGQFGGVVVESAPQI